MVRTKLKEGHYFKGYRVKLYPTIDQAMFIDRCIELNRYIYNWALELEELQLSLFNSGKSDSAFLYMYELDKKFTELRNSKGKEWIKEIPHNSGRSAIRRAIRAYNRFFEGKTKHPNFKSKKDKYGKSTLKSYTTRSDRMFFEDNMLRIEGLPKDDMIYTKYHTGWTKKDRKFYNPVVSKDGIGNYWISFCIDTLKPLSYFEENNIEPLNKPIGIDLNVKKRVVLSTGEIFYAPDIKKYIKRAKRYDRKHIKDFKRYYPVSSVERNNLGDNDIPYSNRAKERLVKMRKAFMKIHNINDNFVKTVTKKIINMRPSCIVMEDLDIIKNMYKKHYIAKQIAYSNFYNIRQTMQFKCDVYGIPFMLAPKGYKSTQLCSICGHERKMYSQKTYICHHCGARIDRDVNAAINLANLAVS